MKIAVFGTGMVGEAIASKLVSLGHDVKMGSRSANNEAALKWSTGQGDNAARASIGTFAEAAAFCETAFLCVKGDASSAVLKAAGAALDGKVVIDVTNPLDFSKGMPPTLFVSNNDSLGEVLQRENPKATIVKTLNTVNCQLMVDAGGLPGEHTMFICGNDAAAKERVVGEFLKPFGWRDVIDLGDITQSRGTEAYLMLWIRLYGALKGPTFNIKVVR